MNKKLVATLMTAAMVAGTMGVTAMAEEEAQPQDCRSVLRYRH